MIFTVKAIFKLSAAPRKGRWFLTRMERLARNKHSSLFVRHVSVKEKTDSSDQNYNLFTLIIYSCTVVVIYTSKMYVRLNTINSFVVSLVFGSFTLA